MIIVAVYINYYIGEVKTCFLDIDNSNDLTFDSRVREEVIGFESVRPVELLRVHALGVYARVAVESIHPAVQIDIFYQLNGNNEH